MAGYLVEWFNPNKENEMFNPNIKKKEEDKIPELYPWYLLVIKSSDEIF